MDIRAIPVALITLAVAACTALPGEAPGALEEPEIERLGQFLYMVPVARDERGCVVYLVKSPFRRFDQALYWRIGKGDFTTDPTAVRCI